MHLFALSLTAWDMQLLYLWIIKGRHHSSLHLRGKPLLCPAFPISHTSYTYVRYTVKPLIWDAPTLKCFSSCCCRCSFHWNQGGFKREWRCSWSSTDRRCSNYIRVISNLLPTKVHLKLEVLRYFCTRYRAHNDWWISPLLPLDTDTIKWIWTWT